jgi:hypothetical protein
MADISVTASSVKPANANTGIGRGTAGATITAGQAVYADPADNFEIKPALSSNQTQANNVVGIALHGASDGQPIAYAYSGDVTFNAVLTAATTYVLGSAAGGISPSADLDSSSNTRYGVVLGMATSTTNLRMGLIASGVLNP